MTIMLFWLLTLLMLAGAVLCILIPLAGKPKTGSDADLRADLYREKLASLEGKIEEQPETARLWLQRAKEEEAEANAARPGTASKLTFAASLGALFLVPAFTAAMYFSYGAPGSIGVAAPASSTGPLANRSVDDLIAMAERQLENNPDDIRGWAVLAGVYGRLNQPGKRANALRQMIRIDGGTADRYADLAEALTVANDGIVGSDALQTIRQALEADKRSPKALSYLAIAREQEGKPAEALSLWQQARAGVEAGSEPHRRISERIAMLGGEEQSENQPGPSQEDIAAAAGMATEDRRVMIEGMVSRLAGRLAEEPDDIDGWSRLLRSYRVLGNEAALREAWQRGNDAFGEQPEKRRKLSQLVSELGYDVREGALVLREGG